MNSSTGMPDQPEEIKKILKRAQNEPAAFHPLYLQYVDRVYYYVLSRVSSHEDAEDITSEVFTRAVKKLWQYQERGSFLAWLLMIARNLTVDYYRNRDNHLLPLSELEKNPESSDYDIDTLALLRSLFLELDSDQKELLILRYNSGLSYGEIAKVMGKREDAIRKTHNKLISMLRSKMEN